MDILNKLEQEARSALANRRGELRIDNIIVGKTLYTMKGQEAVFTDMNFCLVIFENAYGFSYFQGEIEYGLEKFVNKNALDFIDEDCSPHLRISLLDAMFCLINSTEGCDILKGTIREKASARARKLLSHIPNGTRILLLGAATEIIEEAARKNCAISVLDLEKQKVGLDFTVTEVKDGYVSDLAAMMEKSDYVVATGMVFISGTADELFRLSREKGKSLALYMETGSNFGKQLIKYGADVVLSEFFPYYDFFGETKYRLWKNSTKNIF